MENHGEMNLFGEHDDSRGDVRRAREDDNDSSENQDALSGDDQDNNEQPARKKFIRHSPFQIQELEAFFKNCPHPDDSQRMELSRRLGMEKRQIKFWFQNRRTQMKTQLERQENMLLRQENDKLRAENTAIKDAMRNPVCNDCGGPSMLGDLLYEEHQLKIENARLKDELNRLMTLAHGVIGIPNNASALELANWADDFGRLSSPGITLPMGVNLGDGISSTALSRMGISTNEFSMDKSVLVDLAVNAMNELMKMVPPDPVLWTRDMDGRDILNLGEYVKNFPPCIGIKPNGFVTEVSRDSGMVIINSLALVETMMDVTRWVEMFPCLVARANTIDVVSFGMGGSRNGCLQVMDAEFHVLSPLVHVRRVKFLRYCKQQAEGVWAVVDVTIDTNQAGSSRDAFVYSRRLPSGFVVEDMCNGYSKVTWVEHSEYNENTVHHLYRSMIRSGMGFGAQRWIATLQRQSEYLALLMSSPMPSVDPTAMSPGGRRSMLKLAQRMTANFCSGVCLASVRKWDKLRIGSVGEDIQMLTRTSIGDPGEPSGVLLSAAVSVWMPVTRRQLFDFLRNEQMRSKWDILSNDGPIQEMVHIAKGQHYGNCVSLLRAEAINTGNNNTLILQETWTDDSASLLVYAPVDIRSMNVVMDGGDSSYAALLPSGFAIFPDGPRNGTTNNGENQRTQGNGCLLTVCFQIHANSQPIAQLTMESIETVKNLVTGTIQRLKAAVQVD